MEEGGQGGQGGGGEDIRHPPALHNETPYALQTGYQTVMEFLQNYGWFFVIGIVVLLYIKSRLHPALRKMQKKREEKEYEEFDANVAMSRQASIEAARQRMQEQHDAKAEKFAEEQQRREEQRRQQKIEEWERHKEGKGYHSRQRARDDSEGATGGQSASGAPKSKKTTHRPADYNPLMGDSSTGACFRPARRGGGG